MKKLAAALCLALPLVASASDPSHALADAVRVYTSSEAPSYRQLSVHLSHSLQPEAVVLLTGQNWCGSGGCTLLVFRKVREKFTLVSRSTVTGTPIRVLAETSRGWKALIVHSKGRGNVLLRFDGTRYPLNPSLQPVATSTQVRSSTLALN
jgi:hypothetical protein